MLQKIWNFEGRTFDCQHQFRQRLYRRQRPCSTFNFLDVLEVYPLGSPLQSQDTAIAHTVYSGYPGSVYNGIYIFLSLYRTTQQNSIGVFYIRAWILYRNLSLYRILFYPAYTIFGSGINRVYWNSSIAKQALVMDVKTANQIYSSTSATKTQFKSRATELTLPLSAVCSIIRPHGRKTPRPSANDDTCYLCFNSPESHLKVSCRDNDFFSHTAEKARCSISQGRATTRVHDTKCVV